MNGLRTIGLPGAHFSGQQCTIILTNRGAAASVDGGVYFLDSSHSDATNSDTIDHGLDNAVDITTTLIGKPYIAVVARGVYAVGAKGEYTIGDGVRTRILVDGTTDVTLGDPLKPVNAATNLAKATNLTDRWCAIANETRTANTVGFMDCILFSSGRF